jgi:hypothetical protein
VYLARGEGTVVNINITIRGSVNKRGGAVANIEQKGEVNYTYSN